MANGSEPASIGDDESARAALKVVPLLREAQVEFDPCPSFLEVLAQVRTCEGDVSVYPGAILPPQRAGAHGVAAVGAHLVVETPEVPGCLGQVVGSFDVAEGAFDIPHPVWRAPVAVGLRMDEVDHSVEVRTVFPGGFIRAVAVSDEEILMVEKVDPAHHLVADLGQQSGGFLVPGIQTYGDM